MAGSRETTRPGGASWANEDAKLADAGEPRGREDPGPEPTEQDIEDVDGLFERLSIGEVRKYEQTLHQHIERMRGQMRRVAGEHYPELIDAADSVAAMRTSSAQISNQLGRLQAMLQNTRQTPESGSEQPRRNDDAGAAQVYAVAAQAKVLVDTPEQIWKALGSARYLQAALLFLIAQEIHCRLCEQTRAAAQDEADSKVDPLRAFPVIERQWASVAPFHEQICAKAHQALAAADVTAETSASAISAIALLEDVDTEMVCTVFLARRGEAVQGLLDRMNSTATDESLDTTLQEVFERVRQILADYVAIFGVPGSKDRRFASWILTILASVCADADLPMAPLLGEPAATGNSNSGTIDRASHPPKRRLNLSRTKARRRQSSLAGLVLSSALPVSPLADGFGFDDLRSPQSATSYSFSANSDIEAAPAVPVLSGERQQPWREPAQAGSGVFIVAKYLPQEIAQFRPRLPRMLDAGILQPDGDVLDEDAEDMAGLDSYLDRPDQLLRVLATQAQPMLERIAAHSLDLWWRETVASAQQAGACAVEHHVRAVADAARISSSVRRWEGGCAQAWSRQLPWAVAVADPMVSGATGGESLYDTAIGPLLQRRARSLQCQAIDHALSLPETFLQSADIADVLAGHLPWQPLSAPGSINELSANVRAGMDFMPPSARALGNKVSVELLAVWRDAEAWWQQMHGAAVGPESAACAEYLAGRWAAMADRLARWATQAAAAAQDATASTDNQGAAAASALEMPRETVLCLKGAWAFRAVADVSQQLLDSGSSSALLHESWRRQQSIHGKATQKLQDASVELLDPWHQHLGGSLAQAWASQFSSLYFCVPRALRQDGPATHRDVVRAWLGSRPALSSSQGSSLWTTRYAALRRIATSTPAQAAGADVSTSVRALAAQVEMRIQAVGGLGALDKKPETTQQSVCRAFVRAMDTIVARRLDAADETVEWDRLRLEGDIQYVLARLGGTDTAAHIGIHV
ncbi:hypothetical protein GGF46_002729 [Coemansia sp. RSA 552]|nr:hypothetical protein GGF46_002729 [Coemansia sp. RSA 552]